MNGKGISLSYLQGKKSEEAYGVLMMMTGSMLLTITQNWISYKDCLVLRPLDIVHNLFHSLNGDGSFENLYGAIVAKRYLI